MFTTDLGGPYDIALVTNVLHHFAPQTATTLLKRVGEAMKPDGKLVIVGFTVGDQPPDRDPAPLPVLPADVGLDPCRRGPQ